MAGEPRKVILIGSSMGGWAALLTAMAQPARISGLLLINPAPDFTEKLTRPSWSAAQIKALEDDGVVYEPSGYEEPYAYSRALMDDGKKRQILDAPIRLSCPVEILSGQNDKVVPTAYAARLLEVIEINTSDIDDNRSNATSQHVNFTKVMGADHSLSRPQDLNLIIARLENLLKPLS